MATNCQRCSGGDTTPWHPPHDETACSVFLNKMNMTPKMEDLVGVIEFTDEQLDEVDRTIDESIGPMPSFAHIKGQSTPRLAVKEVAAVEVPVIQEEATKSK